MAFEGGSFGADPFGEPVLSAGAEPGRYHAELDLARAESSRVVRSPGSYEYDRVADRRPEAYTPLLEPVRDAERTGSRESA